jgi:hypothetical protein
MDQVQKTAIVETAKIIGILTGIVFVVSAAIALLPLQAVATILILYCLVLCVKAIYTVKLGEAKAKEQEKQIKMMVDQ